MVMSDGLFLVYMSPNVPAFKVGVFYQWLQISNLSNWLLLVDIPTQIIVLFIDRSFWRKLKVYDKMIIFFA